MSNFNYHQTETTLLHAGQVADPTTGSRAVPIYQTTSFEFKDTNHAQDLFGLKEPGNIYSRIGNPTVAVFEERIAELEDGVAAVATASGMAAITLAILNIAQAGDEIIADSNLYGGTYILFNKTLPKYGINVKFVDGTDPDAIKQAITPQTKAIFGEVITNPSLHVFDVETIGAIAKSHGVPLIIDNTFAPYMTKPLTWGADIVVHSATKWIGGHGTSIGGVIVDGGRFNWNNARFPEFNTPDDSYNGLRYVDAQPAAFATKVRVQLLRDIGASLSPQNAFLFLQGLETLHLRIERHNDNAKKVATFLYNHPAIEWVNYPGLESHPSYDLAGKYFEHGAGSVITFGIKGGLVSGRKLINSVQLFSHVANVGEAKSLIIHPASTTHQQLGEKDLEKSGTPEELIRLSIGLEGINDILADLDQAISKATGYTEQITETNNEIIKKLLSSPFSRKDGVVRKKVIAFIGANNKSNETQKQIETLIGLGFHVVTIGEKTCSFTDHVYHQLSDIPYIVDIVSIHENLPHSIIEQLINRQGSVLWVEQAKPGDKTLSHAEAAGIPIITNNSLYDEIIHLRSKVHREPVQN